MAQAPLFLQDTALMWWRRREDDARRGGEPVTTWEGFKAELKKQFYPANAEWEARVKLQRLHHKDGQLKEFVKEFQELILEIPSMPQEEVYLNFMTKLNAWASAEME